MDVQCSNDDECWADHGWARESNRGRSFSHPEESRHTLPTSAALSVTRTGHVSRIAQHQEEYQRGTLLLGTDACTPVCPGRSRVELHIRRVVICVCAIDVQSNTACMDACCHWILLSGSVGSFRGFFFLLATFCALFCFPSLLHPLRACSFSRRWIAKKLPTTSTPPELDRFSLFSLLFLPLATLDAHANAPKRRHLP